VCGQRHAQSNLHLGKTRYPLYRRLDGPQSWSGRLQKISRPLGFGPWAMSPKWVTIPTTLSRPFSMLANAKDHKVNEFRYQTPLLETYIIVAYYFANCMELCKIAKQEALSSGNKLNSGVLIKTFICGRGPLKTGWKSLIDKNMCMSRLSVRVIFTVHQLWTFNYYIHKFHPIIQLLCIQFLYTWKL